MDTSTWPSSSVEFLNEMTMNQTTAHWVTEMFPVTYTLEDTEIASSDAEAEKPKISIFEQLAQQLSPLDETALKNVYEKVWLMLYLKEKEKLKRQEVEIQSIKPYGRGTQQHMTKEKQLQALIKLEETEKPSVRVLTSGVSELNIDDPAIWSSGEIEILREAFKKTKEENHQLRAEINTLKNDINKFNKKYRRIADASESRTEKLNIAVKANERLQIAVNSLKTELKKAEASIYFLSDQLREEREKKCKLSKETHHLRLDLDREKLTRKKLEHDMGQEAEKNQRKMELVNKRISTRYQSKIDKLNEVIEQLQSDLNTERENHLRSKHALDHLRTHFASTDLQTENSAVPGPVTRNQLSKWTY